MSYCLVENDQIVRGPSPLPSVYKNISGFHLDLENAKSYGWLPATITEPSISSTQKKGNRIVTIDNNTVTITWTVVDLTVDEINQIDLDIYNKRLLEIDQEYSRYIKDLMVDFFNEFPNILNTKSDEFKNLHNGYKDYTKRFLVLSEISFDSSTSISNSIRGIIFNDTGTKIFTITNSDDNIREYNLTTPYDLSTLSVVQVTKSVTTEDTSPNGIIFNDTGTKIFMVANKGIHEYSLSTPYSLLTLSLTTSVTVSNYPQGIAFNNDGTKLFKISGFNNAINEYSLSTPYSLSTLSAIQATKSVSANQTNPNDLIFIRKGSTLLITDNSKQDVYEYNLTTPYDLSTLSLVASYPMSIGYITGMTINKIEKRIFFFTSSTIYGYSVP